MLSNFRKRDVRDFNTRVQHSILSLYLHFSLARSLSLTPPPPKCHIFLVCHLLELERQQHNQLKHTWHRANDQFLESQRLLMRDMQRIENVLSSEQLRQVEEIKKRDQEEDDNERIIQTKEQNEEDGTETEPLEDSFLGLSIEEVWL